MPQLADIFRDVWLKLTHSTEIDELIGTIIDQVVLLVEIDGHKGIGAA